jgi:hypothetical protein
VVPTVIVERNLPRLVTEDILLAVEIVSPGTKRSDRVTMRTEVETRPGEVARCGRRGS